MTFLWMSWCEIQYLFMDDEDDEDMFAVTSHA